MLVQNKKKAIVFCPVPAPALADEGFTKAVGVGVKGLKLLPGVNDVNVTLFEACSQHPLIQHMIEEREIVVVDERKAKHANITKLDGLPEKAARQLIRETFDEALLKRWFGEAKNDAAKKAIAEQLEKISPTKGGDKKPEGEGGDKNPKQ